VGHPQVAKLQRKLAEKTEHAFPEEFGVSLSGKGANTTKLSFPTCILREQLQKHVCVLTMWPHIQTPDIHSSSSHTL
jgi:hypothetical protein